MSVHLNLDQSVSVLNYWQEPQDAALLKKMIIYDIWKMFLSTQSVIHISPAVWQTAQCETESFKIYKTVTVLRHIAQIHLKVQYVNTKMHQLETC